MSHSIKGRIPNDPELIFSKTRPIYVRYMQMDVSDLVYDKNLHRTFFVKSF